MKSKNILLIVALLISFGASGQDTPFFNLTTIAKSAWTIKLNWSTYDVPSPFTEVKLMILVALGVNGTK